MLPDVTAPATANAVWLRTLLLVVIGFGAISFCVQAACSSGTSSTGYGSGYP
jgi:hypothetical protein